MRIAFLADPQSGNGFYRGIGPMHALAQRGHAVRQLAPKDVIAGRGNLGDAELLHIHRYTEDGAQLLVQQARGRGMAVVWDNDDDMSSIPKGTPAYKRFGGLKWERRLAQMRRIFRDAQLVTTPSRTLAERLSNFGAPHVAVIENHVPTAWTRPPRRPHGGVVVGWVAGLEHQIDLKAIPIQDVLRRLLDERPDVHVTTVGLGLGLPSDRYRHIPLVKLEELTRYAADFDVGIAPLAPVAMNEARSNIKLKEYASAGVPWLASPTGPYVGLGERQGGRLVADDQWHSELSRLLDKERDRRKLAKRASKWAAQETLEQNAGQWEKQFSAAIARARAGR